MVAEQYADGRMPEQEPWSLDALCRQRATLIAALRVTEVGDWAAMDGLKRGIDRLDSAISRAAREEGLR